MNLKHLSRISQRLVRDRLDDVRAGEWGKLGHWLFTALGQLFLDYPITISLEPSNACNLNCEFCSTPPDQLDRPPQQLPLAKAKPIIRQIAALTHDFWLFLAGEPLLNPEIVPIVAYASRCHLHTTLSTNGTLLNDQLCDQLIKAGLDKLIVSLDGASEATARKMRPGASFEKITRVLKYLIQQKEQGGQVKPRIELQMLISKINESEVIDFENLARELGADAILKTLSVPTWIRSAEESRQIMEKYIPINRAAKTRYTEGQKLKQYRHCRNVKRPVILANGQLTICCYDPRGQYAQGNVFDHNLKSLWQKPVYRKLRRRLKKRQLPLCRICGETYELI